MKNIGDGIGLGDASQDDGQFVQVDYLMDLKKRLADSFNQLYAFTMFNQKTFEELKKYIKTNPLLHLKEYIDIEIDKYKNVSKEQREVTQFDTNEVDINDTFSGFWEKYNSIVDRLNDENLTEDNFEKIKKDTEELASSVL
ncbi:MAG: hypothetical protein K9L98_02575 [Candidatus Pacebacteria bacterium]|nr:hypothetical protein [Candidatus Paceibacterota bacterium]MCF7862869.1 hypothetical protein [Candidatus Paceibacterota bacterium]